MEAAGGIGDGVIRGRVPVVIDVAIKMVGQVPHLEIDFCDLV